MKEEDKLTYAKIQEVLEKLAPPILPLRVFFGPMDSMAELVEELYDNPFVKITRSMIRLGHITIYFSKLLNGQGFYEVDPSSIPPGTL